MSELPENLKQQVLAAIRAAPSPTRSQSRFRVTAWLSLGVLLALGTAAMRGLPHASLDRPASYIAVAAGVALALALGGAAWALTSGGSSLGRPRSTLRALAVLVPPVLALGVLAANAAAPATWNARVPDWTAHAMCLGVYGTLGGALLFIVLYGVRPLDPVAPATTGAALGAVAGAWTSLAISLQCPTPDPRHTLLTHVAPSVFLILLGAETGRRMLGVRYRRRR